MEDLAVYGYIAPSKLKIVLALALTDAVVRDQDIVTVCRRASQKPLPGGRTDLHIPDFQSPTPGVSPSTL